MESPLQLFQALALRQGPGKRGPAAAASRGLARPGALVAAAAAARAVASWQAAT